MLQTNELRTSTRLQQSWGCYQLVDFRFRLKTPPGGIEREAHKLFAHLSLPDSNAPDVVIEVMDDRHQWFLLCADEVVDWCSNPASIVPMLHANVLRNAYKTSGCTLALRAAAVTRDNDCVLMPGASGSGKTTLTAALLSHGFRYCSDELVLLTQEPTQMRPVPTCLSMKTGCWAAVDALFPEVHQLPTHFRSDGKQVRYLEPRGSLGKTRGPQKATRIVFPVWTSGVHAEIRRLAPAEALMMLATSSYELTNCTNSEAQTSLARWVSGLPCFELRYDSMADAVHVISTLR